MTKKSVWSDREPIVRELAGTVPPAEIAERLGVTLGALSFWASRNGISLRVKGAAQTKVPPPIKTLSATEAKSATPHVGKSAPVKRKPRKARKVSAPPTPAPDPVAAKRALDDKLSAASRLLRQHGFTVLQPCPFRQYVDGRHSAHGSLPRD